MSPLAEERINRLHKGVEAAAMDVMRRSLDLNSTAVRRQMLFGLLPGSIVQGGSQCSICSDEQGWNRDPGEQRQNLTILAGLSEDAHYRFSAHLLQRVDFAFDVGLGPARAAGRDLRMQ